MTAYAIVGAHLDCAEALFDVHGYRIWSTPDDPGRCAITVGGTAEEARRAVVDALWTRFPGSWLHEAHPMDPPNVAPCAWCEKGRRYGH